MRLNSDTFFCSVPVLYFGWLGLCALIGRKPNWFLNNDDVPDPISARLIESGWHDTAVVIAVLVVTALVIGNVVVFRRMRQTRERLEYWRNLNAEEQRRRRQ